VSYSLPSKTDGARTKDLREPEEVVSGVSAMFVGCGSVIGKCLNRSGGERGMESDEALEGGRVVLCEDGDGGMGIPSGSVSVSRERRN